MSVWARALGVSLATTTYAAVEADPALHRALLDGIAHGTASSAVGALPPWPASAAWYLVRAGRATVGVAAVQRDRPRQGEATLLALAIAPEQRGRAVGTKALLAAERRLARDGASRLLARVPRTNGHGLYFMLRAGFVPLPVEARPRDDAGWEDTTWFARVPASTLR